MSHLKDFNQEFEVSNATITETVARTIGLIHTTDELDLASPLDLATFFSNLYTLIKCLPKNKQESGFSLLGHSLDLLEIASKRNLLKDKQKFVPVVAALLSSYSNDRVIILQRLRSLTYGLRIHRHEFYLDHLIETLIEYVQTGTEYSELALSVLVNVCFQNAICTNILIRNINSTKFIINIGGYGFLASQIFLILPDESSNNEHQCFLMQVGSELEKAIKDLNVPLLRQIVQFVTTQKFTTVDVDIIKSIVDSVLSGVKGVDITKELYEARDVVMDLMLYLVKFSDCPIEAIKGIAFEWGNSKNALKVITFIANKPAEISRIVEQLPLLTRFFENSEDIEYKINFLRLAKTLSVLSNSIVLDEYVFLDKLSDQALLNNEHSENYVKFFICVADLFSVFSNLDSSMYVHLVRLMNSDKAPIVFAKGYGLKDLESVQMILSLTQCKEFPSAQVAEYLVKGDVQIVRPKEMPQICEMVPKSVEQKLDTIIMRLSDTTSSEDNEIIEMYQSKVNVYRKSLETLNETKRHWENEIANLQNERAILEAQLIESESKILRNLLQCKSLRKTNDSLTAEVNALRLSVSSFSKTSEQKNKKISDLLKKHELDTAKLQEATKDKANMKLKLKESEQHCLEMGKKVDEFRVSLKKYEEHMTLSKKKIEALEVQNESSNKRSMDLQKEKNDLSKLLKENEKQLLLKEQQINQYASEVEENERMRTLVMEMMNKKQRKK